jgi:hypothetical protein
LEKFHLTKSPVLKARFPRRKLNLSIPAVILPRTNSSSRPAAFPDDLSDKSDISLFSFTERGPRLAGEQWPLSPDAPKRMMAEVN